MIDILENRSEIIKLSWVQSLNNAAVKINEFEPDKILEKTVYLNQNCERYFGYNRNYKW